MRFFIDTEFIEGFKKPLFGKRRHFIDLISIGIYCEDGRSYYAISNEYDYNDADDWVKKNVILPIYQQEITGDKRNYFGVNTFHKYIANGKSNEQIANEIIHFVMNPVRNNGDGSVTVTMNVQPTFFGYYSDYDWVLFCSLFGRMIDLPKGFPMFCIDLKQTLDEVAFKRKVGRYATREDNEDKLSFEIRNLKLHPAYPKQTNEHNALADAKWNYELYKFLENWVEKNEQIFE